MADEFFSRAKLTIDSFKIFFETLKSSRENPLKVSDFNLCIENLTFLEQGLKDIEKLGYTKRSAMESVIAADSQLRELRKAAYQATKLLNTRIECIRLLESNLQSREGQLRAWVAAEEERIESRRHESLAEIERIRTTTMDELSLIRQEREASNDCVEDPGEETDVADDSMGEGLDEVVIISLVREMPSEGEESKDQQMDENKNPNEALCQEIISVCHAMDCEALVAIMRLCLIDCGKLEGMSAMKSALESCPDPFLLVSNCFTEKDVTIEICSFLLENLACYSMDRFFYCKVMSSLQRRATSLGKQWIQNGFPRKILGLRAEAEEEFGLLRSLISTFKIESDFGAPQFAEFLAELSTVELVSTAFWVVVEALIAKDRHLDALRFAQKFHIVDDVDVRSILDSYFAEVHRKAFMKKYRVGATELDQLEAIREESDALKAALDCITTGPLQDCYPLEMVKEEISKVGK